MSKTVQLEFVNCLIDNIGDYNLDVCTIISYQKSPDQRYIADSNYCGKVDLMTVSDVVDRYGSHFTRPPFHVFVDGY